MTTRSETGIRIRRVERWFSRLALVAAALLVPFLVLLADVLISGDAKWIDGPATETFDMYLVTHDGRDIGGAPHGIPMALSPMMLYENMPDRKTGRYRSNNFGLRGPDIKAQGHRPRVVLVGGSAAFGLFLKEEQTLAAALQRRLQGIEVLNAGVVGYLSGQQLALALFRLLDLEPDVILAFDGWNDLYDNYWWTIHGNPGSSHRGANVHFNVMENRLVNYRRVQQSPWFAAAETTRSFARRSTILSGLSAALGSGPETPVVPTLDELWLGEVTDLYVSHQIKLRDVARSRGCRLIVALQPELGQLLSSGELARVRKERGPDFLRGDAYWLHFAELYRGFRDRAVRSLSKHDVEAIDGSSALADHRSPASLFLDPVHLNARGYDRMAELLAQRLETLNAR